MLSLTWLAGLVRRRPLRLIGTAAGVACGVALLGSLGAFLTAAKSDMTRRAIADVGVDWQVEAQPGANTTTVLEATRHDAHVRIAEGVWFATTTGLSSTSNGTTQTTGPGQVLGLPAGYTRSFPATVRLLLGTDHGVLLAQQTAANLHATVGSSVSIGRAGLPAARVRVDGIVDLPQADSLFQKVGAPSGAQPQAPPDNVVLLAEPAWHAVFDGLRRARPDQVRFQVHARLDHHLPHDPATAFTRVTGAARHLEVGLSGSALVGDNLAATLDAARSDALYAQLLFLLLGLPGSVLAGLLTHAVAASASARRRREFALLRARGASVATLQRLAAVEAGAVAAVGSVVGIVAAAIIGRVELGSGTFGATTTAAVTWAVIAIVAGIVVTLLAVAWPARRDARTLTVVAARARIGDARPRSAWWFIDASVLGGAALVFWLAGRHGYSLVLAPEGVPTVSVDYRALAGPFLLWIGAGLLGWHVVEAALRRGSSAIRHGLRPLTGSLTAPVVATLRRERRDLAGAVVLVALTIAFAISTSVFDSTYSQQTAVDALLTNGADVTVVLPGNHSAAAVDAEALARVAGVSHVEPMRHQFVYVGADLQDLYGVNPATIVDATRLQNSYFVGGTARALMATLARTPDGALVSAETVNDFQLQKGDSLHLRVRDGTSGALRSVTFHYVGVVKEFPTAPRDSFVVANGSYLASATSASPNLLLLETRGARPKVVAERVRRALGPGALVTDLDSSRHVVGSSLTAVDLRSLTRVELGFALVLAAAAGGLVLALGLADRRRNFAIATALGARSRQVAAFVHAEALVVVLAGVMTGLLAGAALSAMLVRVLTGVFDPPPAQLAIPWGYLGAMLLVTLVAIATAAQFTLRAARRPPTEVLRDL